MTRHTSTPVSTTRPIGRSTRTAPWHSTHGRLWIGQGVLAALYVMAAVPKLSNDPHTLAAFGRLGIGAAGMYTIGILEVAGAIALLIPQLCGVAALAFVSLMSGATGLTLAHIGFANAAVPAAFLVAAAVVAWARRDRTAQLAATVVTLARQGGTRPPTIWPRDGR